MGWNLFNRDEISVALISSGCKKIFKIESTPNSSYTRFARTLYIKIAIGLHFFNACDIFS
jgi:hypothetical protein